MDDMAKKMRNLNIIEILWETLKLQYLQDTTQTSSVSDFWRLKQ